MPKPTRLELVVPVVAMLLMLFATTAYAAWTVVDVRTTSSDIRFDNSINLAVINGRPSVTYWAENRVEYTAYDNNQWITSIVEDDLPVGTFPSIQELDGQPIITYNTDDSGLRFAWYEGNSWKSTTIDTGSIIESSASLSVVNGAPVVTYIKIDQLASLQYATLGNQGWITQTVTSDRDFFPFSKVIVVDGKPALSWMPNNGDPLQYAQFNGIDWDVSSIPSTENADRFSLISMEAVNGQPAIAYFASPPDNSTTFLQYAVRSNQGWTIEAVDRANGFRPWLAVIDGQPAIAYDVFDAAPKLKYARRDGLVWSVIDVEPSGLNPVLVDLNGQPIIATTAFTPQATARLFYGFPTPADVNSNGRISPADAVGVLNRFGQSPQNDLAPYDVNNDGIINAQDYQAVIDNLGTLVP